MRSRRDAAFLGIEYEHRQYLWDGRENKHGVEDGSDCRYALDMPRRHERVPCVQTKLAGTIVRRFTDMLFGVKRRPAVESDGDKDGTAWLRRAFEMSCAWEELTKARDNGGAMGTPVVLVRLKDGKLRMDALNPRNCRPKWKDRKVLELESVEEVYLFLDEEENPETGARDLVERYYRRIVDCEKDRIWRAVDKPKGTGMPKWGAPDETHEHGLGVCPVMWGQNEDVDETIDGRSDFDGQLPNIEQLDFVESECTDSIIHNLDATLVLTETSAAEAGVVRTGHYNTLCLPKAGAAASFLEVSGAAIKAGDDRSAKLRSQILEACQCVLVDPKDLPGMGQGRDALEAVYRPMLSRCDRMREQYGKLVRRVAELMVMLVRKADEAGEETDVLTETRDVGGEPTRVVLSPPEKDWTCRLSWPRYFEPTSGDKSQETAAAGTAVRDGVVSQRTAVQSIASMWGIEDVDAEIEAIQEDQAAAQAGLMEDGMDAAGDEEFPEDDELPGEGEEPLEDEPAEPEA